MKKNEKGRSMVEMLGVLAIIGVLSIGGIFGYTVAMRKYQAGEVLQIASLLATSARTANAGNGKTLTLGESDLNTTAGGIALNTTETKAVKPASGDVYEVTIKLTTADEKLCTALMDIAPTDNNRSKFKVVSCS